MTDIEFLTAIRDYVEDCQQRLDSEYGLGRSLEELVTDGVMPNFYDELLRRIDEEYEPNV